MATSNSKSKVLDELEIISAVADLLASNQDLKTILQEAISLVSSVTRADACFLYLFDPNTSELVLSASQTPHPKDLGKIRLKLGEGVTGWVAEHKTPVAIPQYAKKDKRFLELLVEDTYEAFLSVPILIKENVVGVINAQHRKPHQYSPRLIKLVTLIGRQIGRGIELARTRDESQRRGRTLETLSAVSNTLALDRYPEEIMQLIVKMTAQMMGSNICSILMLDEKKKVLKIVAAQSTAPEYFTRPPVKVDGSFIGQVVLAKKPLIAKDVRQEPHYQLRELAVQLGLVSLLSVPMTYKNKVIGVMNSYTSSETTFSDEQISFLQSVANQCAAALENTRLLSEKLAVQEALEARKVVEKAKGILMMQKGLSEEEAFKEIQHQSMDRRKSMKEIAEAVILAHDLNRK